MKIQYSRREFVGTLAALPLAARAAFAGQVVKPPFPVIDTHIHLFDRTRPEGAPYPMIPRDGGEPPQGMIALPNRYQAIAEQFGVVGAVVVEASPRLEDNQWILDVAKDYPILVGLVGRIEVGAPDFPKHLERFVKNPLFFGIRQGQLHLGLDKPEYIANLKRLADANCSLDVDTPRQGPTATDVLVKVLDKVPSLKLVMDHLPDVPYTVKFPDAASKAKYVEQLKELGQRPQVYAKLSEVPHRQGDKVPTDIGAYKEWLDQVWSVFGEDRMIFGSDWPQNEIQEQNAYPNVFNISRNYVMSKGPSAMEKVFWKNSMKPYRWVQRLPTQRKA